MKTFIICASALAFLCLAIISIYLFFPVTDRDISSQVEDLSNAASLIAKQNNLTITSSSEVLINLINIKAPNLIERLKNYDIAIQPIIIDKTVEVVVFVCEKNSYILKDISTTRNIIDEYSIIKH